MKQVAKGRRDGSEAYVTRRFASGRPSSRPGLAAVGRVRRWSRPDPPDLRSPMHGSARPRAHRDSGSSRSFPQRSDGRQPPRSGYVTLGGRKSPLLAPSRRPSSSPRPTRPTSSLFLSLSPSRRLSFPLSPREIRRRTICHQLFTNKSSSHLCPREPGRQRRLDTPGTDATCSRNDSEREASRPHCAKLQHRPEVRPRLRLLEEVPAAP